MLPLWHADFVEQYGFRESYHSLLSGIDVRGQLSGRDAVHQSLYLWSKTLLPCYILNMLGDRMEMAHSVEGRVPFLTMKSSKSCVRSPCTKKFMA
jgi:asparagine synthase (glutamine-hydrolysing)